MGLFPSFLWSCSDDCWATAAFFCLFSQLQIIKSPNSNPTILMAFKCVLCWWKAKPVLSQSPCGEWIFIVFLCCWTRRPETTIFSGSFNKRWGTRCTIFTKKQQQQQKSDGNDTCHLDVERLFNKFHCVSFASCSLIVWICCSSVVLRLAVPSLRGSCTSSS